MTMTSDVIFIPVTIVQGDTSQTAWNAILFDVTGIRTITIMETAMDGKYAVIYDASPIISF